MLKRCYYICNSYDGAYFVLTDDVENYIQKMASYVINLENSKKTNHYTFGSIEMTQAEYEKNSTEAIKLETSLIEQKNLEEDHLSSLIAEEQLEIVPKTSKSHLILI